MAVIGRQDIQHRVSGAIAAGQTGVKRLFRGRRANDRFAAAPRIFEAVLAIFLGMLLGLTAMRLLAPLPLPNGNVSASIAEPTDATTALTVKNPFPVVETAAVIDDSAPDVADTSLDLTLTGVWANEQGGSATIETPDGKQGRFAIGDEIVTGVTLDSVYPNQVIINRSGVRESLRFEGKEAVAATPAPVQQQAAAPAPDLRDIPATGFLDVMRLAPAIDENGNFAIDIYAARDRQTFNAYGLRDGDRVISINGSPPPSDPSGIRAVASMLQREGEAVIVVRRGEREIPVSLSLEGLGNR